MPLIINGEVVDDGLIDAEFGQIKAHFEQQANVSCCERDDEFLGYAKENVIARILLAQAAQEKIPAPAAEEIDEKLNTLIEEAGSREAFYFNLGVAPGGEDAVREELAKGLQVERLVDEVSGDVNPPTETGVSQYYETHKDEFMSSEEIRATHIFKSLQRAENREAFFSELREARSKAQAGENFMALVRSYSDKPEDEADLGWFKRGDLMEEFELVTFSMEVGEVSPVFATQWGMHLAKLTDRKPAEHLPLEEVEDEIAERITAERRDEKLKAFIDQRKANAEISDAPDEEAGDS